LNAIQALSQLSYGPDLSDAAWLAASVVLNFSHPATTPGSNL
jgi:hypothetical protein